MTGHRIHSTHYPKGVKGDAVQHCVTICTCGWEGTVGTWDAHRGILSDTVRKRAHRATGHTRWELRP